MIVWFSIGLGLGSGNFLFHTFFCFTYFVFCVFVSLTAVRISRSVYFFKLYDPEEERLCLLKYQAIFCFIHFLLYVLRLLCLRFFNCRKDQSFRIFFTSNVLLIQVYLRSGNSQRLVAVVLPVYKLCILRDAYLWGFPGL